VWRRSRHAHPTGSILTGRESDRAQNAGPPSPVRPRRAARVCGTYTAAAAAAARAPTDSTRCFHRVNLSQNETDAATRCYQTSPLTSLTVYQLQTPQQQYRAIRQIASQTESICCCCRQRRRRASHPPSQMESNDASSRSDTYIYTEVFSRVTDRRPTSQNIKQLTRPRLVAAQD